jgi:hypothetical protein
VATSADPATQPSLRTGLGRNAGRGLGVAALLAASAAAARALTTMSLAYCLMDSARAAYPSSVGWTGSEYCLLFWWDFPFFHCICRRCFVCVYPFITLVSCSVYFWRAGSLGVSLAGRVIFSFCVGLRFVECQAGTIYLGVSLGWVAGLYGFFFSWALLRWVRYDLNSGEGMVRLSLLSSVCCLLSWRAVVRGRAPFSL